MKQKLLYAMTTTVTKSQSKDHVWIMYTSIEPYHDSVYGV